jgi:hypothetical protein
MLLFSAVSNGQEMLGVGFSIYSGVSSAAINPALLTGTRVFMDVNIVSADIGFANDMIYFSPGNKTIPKMINGDTTAYNNGVFKWGRSFNYYRNTNDKYFATNVKIIGPSFMIQADRHAFGITTTFRSFHSGNHIPYSVPFSFYEGLEYEEFHNVEFNNGDYSFVSMSWSEVGLSYAYNFYDLYSTRLTFGITAKALFGYEAGYTIMHNANYIVENSSTIDFKNIDMDIGFALPIGYDTVFETDYAPLVKGYGAGIDVGLVFTKLKSTLVYEGDDKLCAKPYNDYQFKIGLSILDIGGITFNKDTQLHKFDNVSKYWEDFDTIQFRGINDALRGYSEGFYGDPDASFAGDRIRVNLPTTISLQFDYHLTHRIYLAALWMHPLKFTPNTLWRPAQLAFIPRYENRMFGVSVPISLFNYKDPRIGLAVRVYSITIGTERFGSLLGISNFNGMDIYFSFRFNIGKGACSSYQRGACTNQNFGNDW